MPLDRETRTDPREELESVRRKAYVDPEPAPRVRPLPAVPQPIPSREVLPTLRLSELSLLGTEGNAAFDLLEQIQSQWRQHKARSRGQSLALDFVYSQMQLVATAELRRILQDIAHGERLVAIDQEAAERGKRRINAINDATDTLDKLITFVTASTGKLEAVNRSNPTAGKQVEVYLSTIYRALHTLAVSPAEE